MRARLYGRRDHGARRFGIGANTAIFSVIDRVLLRPLPFPDSERIMRLQRHYPNGEGPSVSIPKFMAWKQSRAFQSMAAYDFGSVGMNLGAGDRQDPVNAVHVTAGFFDVFGVQPILGRTFTPQEDLPNAGKYAVLTYNLWNHRLGADREIAGKTILLNCEHYTITGVSARMVSARPARRSLPAHQFDPTSNNQGHIYYVAGRLAPGATIDIGASRAERHRRTIARHGPYLLR